MQTNFITHNQLRISSVGFQTRLINLADFKENETIFLENNNQTLPEIKLLNKKNSTTILNDFAKGSNQYYATGNLHITQLAVGFQAPVKQAVLQEINIYTQGNAATFRVRIYGVDSLTGAPSAEWLDSLVEFTSSHKKITVSLESYHIVLPQQKFFVAVEWLFIPQNAKQVTVTQNHQKQSKEYFYPTIGYQIKNQPQQLVWVLHYNGQWTPINEFYKPYHFLISAKINY